MFVVYIQDRFKRSVTGDNESAQGPTLKQELQVLAPTRACTHVPSKTKHHRFTVFADQWWNFIQELKQKAGADVEYDMVPVPVRRG